MSTEKVKWLIRIIAALAVAGVVVIVATALGGGKEKPEPRGQPTSTPSVEQTDGKGETLVSPPPSLKSQGIESTGEISAKSTGNYRNNSIVEYRYSSTGTISLGLRDGGEGDYIYLNPKCSEATSQEKVGFFISSSRSEIDVASKSASASTDANMVIVGRTYDKLASAKYENDEEYGARWKNDSLFDGKINEGTVLNIRAIRLVDGYLLAMCRAEIKYDSASDSYYLASIINADVNQGDLEEATRAAIVADAIDFIKNPDRGPTLMYENESYWSTSRQLAKVEKVKRPYFSTLYDENNIPRKSGAFSKCDVYAVNFPLTAFGFITVYYAPELQLEGFKTATAPGSTDLNLKVFGYDAFCPFTEKTLMASDNFLSPSEER